MSPRTRLNELAFRASSAAADVRRALRLAWYRVDTEVMAFGLIVGFALLAFGYGLHVLFVRHDRTQVVVRELEQKDVLCLAKNIYYESRGEPAEGQYAVAEVTMNRLASSRYPDSVCAVVHEMRWDEIRQRYVGAFSWTEFDELPDPEGEAWAFAQKVAEEVYYGRAEPQVGGATFYHANTIRPSWARTQVRVARIGRHVFYR